MALARTHTTALNGIDTVMVEVQAQIRPGLAGFQLVGLPTNTVKEARERIQAAFHTLGIALPAKRITINLAPADILKDGNHYDLPIAIALLCALGGLPPDAADNALFLGEVALDGTLNPVTGALPAAIHAHQHGLQRIFVPAANGPEAAWAGEVDVFAPTNLLQLVEHLRGHKALSPCTPNLQTDTTPLPDFAEVKGQETARRVAEIAAAGGHNLLLQGPPGAGKSLLARRLPAILPPLTSQEALETSMIHSVAGLLPESGLLTRRPFRDPHHTASAAALCGGGHQAKPGEISLAHRGVLFLDELPEFQRNVLETLRQPMESGTITVSRANAHINYPARFQLVAAMNPCPCGYLGHPQKACTCTPAMVQKYQARLSGPFLDRIDLTLNVPAVNVTELTTAPQGESTQTIATRVLNARQFQQKRGQTTTNTELEGKTLTAMAQATPEAMTLLNNAAEKLHLSARAYHRTLKVARTIADLAQEAEVAKPHIAEALSYRSA